MNNLRDGVVSMSIGGMIAVAIVAFTTGDPEGALQLVLQCMLPLIAIFVVLGMCVFVGLLVDPKGTLDMLKEIASDWNDILSDD